MIQQEIRNLFNESLMHELLRQSDYLKLDNEQESIVIEMLQAAANEINALKDQIELFEEDAESQETEIGELKNEIGELKDKIKASGCKCDICK